MTRTRKRDVFWIKYNLAWSKLKSVGAFLYGVSVKYGPSDSFFIIYPELGIAVKASNPKDIKSCKFLAHETIPIGQDPETIGKFIFEQRCPCFIFDNTERTKEILTMPGLENSVDVYFTTDHDRFCVVDEQEKTVMRLEHLPKIVAAVGMVWKKVSDKESENGREEEVL